MAGVRVTLEVVAAYKDVRPRPAFRFPRVAFSAPLNHVGKHLARNQTAHQLLAALLIEAAIRKLPPPTVLMLQAALEDQGIPVVLVEFEKLGIPGHMVVMHHPSKDPPS